jgi:hypothetical protein
MNTAVTPVTVVKHYFDTLAELLHGTVVTSPEGTSLTLEQGIDWMRQAARETHTGRNKIMFVDNGGSAGISSHLAIDYAKNGGLRATAFNDPAALTWLGNDLGYDQVFAKLLELRLRSGDLLVAISSSGRYANILNCGRRRAVWRSPDRYLLRFWGRQRATPCRRCQLLRRIQRIRLCRGCASVALPRRPRHRDELARRISLGCRG